MTPAQLAALQPPALSLTDAQLDELADMALQLSHKEAERTRRVLLAHEARSYRERTDGERRAARATVARVVQALVMLGYIEAPP